MINEFNRSSDYDVFIISSGVSFPRVDLLLLIAHESPSIHDPGEAANSVLDTLPLGWLTRRESRFSQSCGDI